VAVVLAGAIVAGLLAGGALRNHQILPAVSPKAKLTPAVTVPVPSPVEIDAVDASTAFATFWKPPAAGGTETFWFTRTTDGGAHWSKPVKIGQLRPGEGDSGHHIHFIDPNNGVFYGGSTMTVTHDGGRTWHDSGLKVLETVVASGRAPWLWAVTYPCPKGTTPACPYRVFLSKDAGRTWSQSWNLPGTFAPRFAVAFGDGGLVITSNPTGDLYITSDGGARWSTVSGRCGGNTAEAYTATSDGRELWQMCSASFPDFTPKTLYVSEDGGTNWVKRALPQGGAFFELCSPSTGIAFLLTAQTQTQVTSDGGKKWRPVDAPAVYRQLVFTSPKDGWGVRDDGSTWISHDGGHTWTAVQPLA
jgi:photosystem II stability/assembly factor-like uncharacterized protein